MTRLGILVALPEEARCLAEHTDTGKIIELSDQTLLCISGIGAQRARAAGERLLSSGAQALLSWGTAVALNPVLASGSLLLPAKVIATDGSTLAVSRDWHATLYRNLHNHFSISTHPIAESAGILFTAGDKQALYAVSGAAAADMESAALGVLAHAAGVPFAVLRVTVDTADMRLPNWLPQNINDDGHVQIGALLIDLLKHPADWSSFARLAHSFRSANTTLATIIQRTGIHGLNAAPTTE